jgi:hypothetical protein
MVIFILLLVNDIPYKFIKLKVKNADSGVGNSANFTLHLLDSD